MILFYSLRTYLLINKDLFSKERSYKMTKNFQNMVWCCCSTHLHVQLILIDVTLFLKSNLNFPALYVKIPKISPGAYIFQRPFLRGLSTEGNLRFKIDWVSLIVGRKSTIFALFYFVFEGSFQVQAPGGLIFGGAI